mmetsp:Transcript_138427/g.240716  ORF Transcript_138427/g.240716 Transcript_138427/m.240716 type:complete len:227 (-) Transcript_138427:578-1258(-)
MTRRRRMRTARTSRTAWTSTWPGRKESMRRDPQTPDSVLPTGGVLRTIVRLQAQSSVWSRLQWFSAFPRLRVCVSAIIHSTRTKPALSAASVACPLVRSTPANPPLLPPAAPMQVVLATTPAPGFRPRSPPPKRTPPNRVPTMHWQSLMSHHELRMRPPHPTMMRANHPRCLSTTCSRATSSPRGGGNKDPAFRFAPDHSNWLPDAMQPECTDSSDQPHARGPFSV